MREEDGCRHSGQWQMQGRFPRRWHGQEEEQRGERGDPRLGASCSVLPCSNRGAGSKRPTLPLPIPITQALLLCFQAWFNQYLLTQQFFKRDDKEPIGKDHRVTPIFYFRGTWQTSPHLMEILFNETAQSEVYLYGWRKIYVFLMVVSRNLTPLHS